MLSKAAPAEPMLQLIPQPLFNLGFQPDHLVIDVRLHDTHLARGLIAGGQHDSPRFVCEYLQSKQRRLLGKALQGYSRVYSNRVG